MTPTELDSMLAVLQKRGVRRFKGCAMEVELGPEPVSEPPGIVTQQQIADDARKEAERLLYAATEGMP